jgi:hypothetical protein
VLAAASVYVFRGVWNPLNTIKGADASLWVPFFVQTWTEGVFVPRWFPHFLAGIAQQFQFLSHSLPLILTLPPHRFHGFQFMLDTFLAGAFMFAFLRDQRMGRFGSLAGGLSFQLGNSLLTSVRQGALWKLDTACWVPLFLLFFSRILDDEPRRARNCMFAGATLGLQFLGGEVQLVYYVCLLALAYFAAHSAGELWNARGSHPFSVPLKATGRRLSRAALCAALGILFAGEVFCSYISYARDNENVGVESAADNWRFATEFSFPPEETLSLALSGSVFENGSRLREHMGRRIARITDDYMGIVVLMFAFLALLGGRRRAYFFACAAVAALVISFGKYFPLPYRLIYELPAMKGLRNPHKWLFIAALCVPILAGMGADYWRNAPSSHNRRIVGALILFVALIAGLTWLSPVVAGATPRGLGPSPAVFGPLVVLIAASLACIMARTGRIRKSVGARSVLSAMVILLLAGDLIANASKFILYYNYQEKYVEDELVRWFRSRPEPFRVKLWSESAYLRDVVTEVLPYWGIDVADAIMSRRPGRYSEIFRAAREDRLPFEKLFQLLNVKYFLSSSAVRGVNVSMSPIDLAGVDSGAASADDYYLYEFNDFLPRAYLVDTFEVSDPEQAIDSMRRPDFDLRRVVILEASPGLIPDGEEGPSWTVTDFTRSPHRVSMRITVDRPAILVLQEFLDNMWHAFIDGQEVEILRANHLMRAVVVPEGAHAIAFSYKPALWGYHLTVAGWLLLALLVLIEALRAVMRGRHRGE